MAQIADPDSRRIIASTLREAKTPQAVGKELDLPTSTLYRKITELKTCGLLMVDRIVVRDDGKREPAYLCSFAEMTITAGKEGVELELVLTERGMERRWFELFFPKAASGSQGRSGAVG